MATDFFENAENHQPRREGRAGNVVMQGTVEPVKARKQADEAKRKFDTVRDAQEDPLGAFVDYIARLKEVYTGNSREVNDALHEAKSLFHDREEYKNDPRLFGIFLQIADKQKDPRETFDFMIENGIGVELPKFYLARAAVYERAKDFRTAEESYQRAVGVARGGKKEILDLATLHLAHFKRRMARLAQESRAMHGPSSPEAARAARTASRALRPGMSASAAPPLQGAASRMAASSVKRPQFAVFEERRGPVQHHGARPADAMWPHLETESTAVENHGPAQPWTAVPPLPQRTGSAIKPPSFPVFREDAPPSSSERLGTLHRGDSAVKPPSFTVYSESAVAPTPRPPSFTVYTEAAAPPSQPSFAVYTETAQQEAETVASTPASADQRAEQTINTRRALDDMFEMFASPSMSVVRRQTQPQHPQTNARQPAFTPAVWPRLDEEEDGQNVSPNVLDPVSRRQAAQATTGRHRRQPRTSGRPILTTLEHHEERVSPSFRRETRFPPPAPQERFVVARDPIAVAPLNDDDDEEGEGADENNTFGISSVLAFEQARGNGRRM
jgi:hypothetical protein